jgi:hypothetical protein
MRYYFEMDKVLVYTVVVEGVYLYLDLKFRFFFVGLKFPFPLLSSLPVLPFQSLFC